LRRQLDGLLTAKVMNAYLGRELPGLLADVGLELVGGEVDATVARFGDQAFEWHRSTMQAAAPACVAAGLVSEDEHARLMRLMVEPATTLTSVAIVAGWAQRRAS
jgi:hypothetical protein